MMSWKMIRHEGGGCLYQELTCSGYMGCLFSMGNLCIQAFFTSSFVLMSKLGCYWLVRYKLFLLLH